MTMLIRIARPHTLNFRLQKNSARWMSVRPVDNLHASSLSPVVPRKKVTIQSLLAQKASGTPITMLTAYDYPTASAASANSLVDITLVGDSLAQVCLGYTSTTELTLDEMIHHCRAVARGTTHPFLVADMPFGTYHSSRMDHTLANATQLFQRGRIEGLKLEGGEEIAPCVQRLTEMGIPVMAHVGLLPQRHVSLSGYRVQGKSSESARKVVSDALALEQAGAFSIVVEAVPKELGKYITEKLRIPTIGIGAGSYTDGQVLVWDDVMSTWSGRKAKFVRRFADVRSIRDAGVEAYAQAVRSRSFPGDSESYSMDQVEWERFLEAERDSSK